MSLSARPGALVSLQNPFTHWLWCCHVTCFVQWNINKAETKKTSTSAYPGLPFLYSFWNWMKTLRWPSWRPTAWPTAHTNHQKCDSSFLRLSSSRWAQKMTAARSGTSGKIRRTSTQLNAHQSADPQNNEQINVCSFKTLNVRVVGYTAIANWFSSQGWEAVVTW